MEKVPIKEKIHHLQAYPWSSLPGYISKRKKAWYVDYTLVLGEYGGDTDRSRKNYLQTLYAEIDKGFDMRRELVGKSILGGTEFIEWVKDTFLDGAQDRERPSVKGIHRHSSTDAVFRMIEQETSKGLEALRTEKGELRQLAMEFLYREGGLTGPEIGSLFNIDYSSVSQERKRFRERMVKTKKLKVLYERLEMQMSTSKI